MATKKTLAGDKLGTFWNGSTGNTPQPFYITATDTIKGSKVIALTTVQIFGTTNYVAVSREFVKEQLANTTNKTSLGNQLILEARYASVSLDTLALASELSTMGINAWSDPAARAANTVTDLGITGTATLKLGFPKYDHKAEIVGFDYDDAPVATKTPEQIAADAASDAASKRNKIYLIVGAVSIAVIVVLGFATDWKFSFKKGKKKDK